MYRTRTGRAKQSPPRFVSDCTAEEKMKKKQKVESKTRAQYITMYNTRAHRMSDGDRFCTCHRRVRTFNCYSPRTRHVVFTRPSAAVRRRFHHICRRWSPVAPLFGRRRVVLCRVQIGSAAKTRICRVSVGMSKVSTENPHTPRYVFDTK